MMDSFRIEVPQIEIMIHHNMKIILLPSSESLHHRRNIWYNPGKQQTGIQL
jgi:hypothetical protein